MQELATLTIRDPEQKRYEFVLTLTYDQMVITVSKELREQLEKAEKDVRGVPVLGGFLEKVLDWAGRKVYGLVGPYRIPDVEMQMDTTGLAIKLGGRRSAHFQSGNYDPQEAAVFIERLRKQKELLAGK